MGKGHGEKGEKQDQPCDMRSELGIQGVRLSVGGMHVGKLMELGLIKNVCTKRSRFSSVKPWWRLATRLMRWIV